jgi:hypothetical protein
MIFLPFPLREASLGRSICESKESRILNDLPQDYLRLNLISKLMNLDWSLLCRLPENYPSSHQETTNKYDINHPKLKSNSV